MGWLLLSSNLFAQKAIEIKVWPDVHRTPMK